MKTEDNSCDNGEIFFDRSAMEIINKLKKHHKNDEFMVRTKSLYEKCLTDYHENPLNVTNQYRLFRVLLASIETFERDIGNGISIQKTAEQKESNSYRNSTIIQSKQKTVLIRKTELYNKYNSFVLTGLKEESVNSIEVKTVKIFIPYFWL